MNFCGVDTHFPWGNRGGPENCVVLKGVCKNCAEFLCIRPPLQVFVNGPLRKSLVLGRFHVCIALYTFLNLFHYKTTTSLPAPLLYYPSRNKIFLMCLR